jgi:hypothetical protein
MKKFALSITLGVYCSLAWSQTSRSLPPLPPPPNPASVATPGSPSFYIAQNNMMPTQRLTPLGNGLNFLGSGDLRSAMSSSAQSNQFKSWQLPKSFESSIQGMQFLNSNPSK